MNCNHVFPYWSVIPPSHCPRCGACLGCVFHPPATPSPWPYRGQWGPYYSPYMVNVCTTSATTSATPLSSL